MLLDDQAKKYRALDVWFNTPQGRCVAQAFMAELMQVKGHLTGNRLIQLGSCGDNQWLSSLKFKQKWLVSPCVVPQKSTLIGSLTMLPIERNSIDCVIAPLSLEAFTQAKNPIDEIDRVLKPMGYVVFFGINPLSFWGASLFWRRLNCFGGATATLTSSLSLKRIMLLRGYVQCALSGFYYIPPVESGFLIKKLEFLNVMGKMVSPFPAGFYCFIVQKYQCVSPSLRFPLTEAEYLVQQKSSLQPSSQWIHDELT